MMLRATLLAALIAAPGSDPGGEPPRAEPPATVTLAQVLRLLREASPRTAASRAQVGIAQAETVAAGVLPNPSFDYSGSRLTSGVNTGAADTDQYSIELPLLVLGQRAERKRSAGLGVMSAEARAAQDLAERAREARDRFTSLLARQEQVRLLEESRDDLERVAKVVRVRAEAGDKSRYDALRTDLELREMEAALSAARADVEEASGALAALVGLPRWKPRAEGQLQPSDIDVDDEEALWGRAQQAFPALVAARSQQAAAHEAIDLARRERLPVPVLFAGMARTRDAASDSVVAGLSVPLPVLDRGQGELARATARENAADLELAAQTAEARAQLESAVAVLRQRRDALSRIESDVMSRLPEMRQMAEDAYREGQAGVLELLDALRSRTSARLIRLDHVEGVVKAENDLRALLGATDQD